MNDEYVRLQLERHEREIEELKKTTHLNERERITMEVSNKYLSENINKLSLNIESLTEEVKNINLQIDPIKRHIETHRGVFRFLRDNWFRIPTTIVFIYAILYAVVSLDGQNMGIKNPLKPFANFGDISIKTF